MLHSDRTTYTLGELEDLTRLQLSFIIQCQVVYAEKLEDLENRNKFSHNPLTIYDTDDDHTRMHKIELLDALIMANGQELENG